jgi:hypothetical protein
MYPKMQAKGEWMRAADRHELGEHRNEQAPEAKTLWGPVHFNMARPERFELPTPWFVARYSIQLSYGRAVFEGAHPITSDFAAANKDTPSLINDLAGPPQGIGIHLPTHSAASQDPLSPPRRGS